MSAFGKFLYHWYYRPLAACDRIRKLGVINYFRVDLARRKMIAAANTLKGIENPALPVYQVYILTGKKYWYQTAFCLYSLQKVTRGMQINAILVDDGSFDDQLVRQIRSQFPMVRIQSAGETEKRLKQYLPAERYPTLRKKRENYPHIRKLTDIHAGQTGWKMVLDSDMLFFKEAELLESWLKNPSISFFLQDPFSAYYYTLDLMSSLAGQAIVPNLNVGMAGLDSENIDWDSLESWIVELEAREGANYLLEQALSAMIVAGKPVLVAPKDDYQVLPAEQETRVPDAVLHHYVAESKEWYYKNAWRIVLDHD
jgi:hypothetical protein